MTPAGDLPLRDIHLPPPVSWWPPAPGWWAVLAALVAAAVIALLWRWWRARTALSRRALAELAAIRAAYAADRDVHRAAQALSMLCRRLARVLDPASAALTGEPWLARLDAWSGSDAFTAGAGRSLGVAPYRAAASADIEALFALLERWLRALKTHEAAGRV